MNALGEKVAASKLVALLACMIFVAVAPPQWTGVLLALALGAAILGRVDWGRFCRRMAPILAIAAVMAVGALWSHAGQDSRRPLEAALRAVVAGCLLVAFSERTSLPEVFLGIRTLGVPALLTTSLALMLRSVDVLREERAALLRSRAARGGEQTSWAAEWRGRAGLVGLLLVRAMDRSERVHRAMKARGWSAEPDR